MKVQLMSKCSVIYSEGDASYTAVDGLIKIGRVTVKISYSYKDYNYKILAVSANGAKFAATREGGSKTQQLAEIITSVQFQIIGYDIFTANNLAREVAGKYAFSEDIYSVASQL